MKKFFIICRGLPGSGKSTLARQITTAIVNRDSIRKAKATGPNFKWSKDFEKNVVIATRDAELKNFFLREITPVICDDTNILGNIEDLKAIAKNHGYQVVILDFTEGITVAECINRDMMREASVGEKVIRKFQAGLKPKHKNTQDLGVIPYNPKVNLPECVIFDLDGTVAIPTGRSPFDNEPGKVLNDLPRTAVIAAIKGVINSIPFPKVFAFSGRKDTCKDDTLLWLSKHCKFLDTENLSLCMRAASDIRRDSIVKKELFDCFVRNNYSVTAVFDDRPQVIEELWYPLFKNSNTTIFSVGDGTRF